MTAIVLESMPLGKFLLSIGIAMGGLVLTVIVYKLVERKENKE